MLEVLLVLISAVLYPALHLLNGWVFGFAEVAPHVGLIYLPAFLRMLNVLVLGKFRGTVATALGGFALLALEDSANWIDVANIACSAAGPLIAVWLFHLYFQRGVNLLNLRDLAVVTLGYCVSNSLVHHLMWSLVSPAELISRTQLFWMMLGDLNGTLIGAYLLKWSAPRLGLVDQGYRG